MCTPVGIESAPPPFVGESSIVEKSSKGKKVMTYYYQVLTKIFSHFNSWLCNFFPVHQHGEEKAAQIGNNATKITKRK